MGDKYGARIGEDPAQCVGVAQTQPLDRYCLIAQEVQRFEDAPVDYVHFGRTQALQVVLKSIKRVRPANIGTVAHQSPIVFIGDEKVRRAEQQREGGGDPGPRNGRERGGDRQKMKRP